MAERRRARLTTGGSLAAVNPLSIILLLLILLAGSGGAATETAPPFAVLPELPPPLIVPGEIDGFGMALLARLQGDVARPRIVRSPPAYDAATRRLYHISLARRQLEIIDLGDPARPRRIARMTDPDGVIGIPTAVVALDGGVLALAGMPLDRQAPGRVSFLDGDGRQAAPAVAVGVRPWVMVASLDRRRLVVANAGEPDGRGNDPEGSISVIDLGRGADGRLQPRGVTLDFGAYAARATELARNGVRLGPAGVPLPAALEPQGAAISEDGRTAFVTLQRNNAIARVALDPPAIIDIRGLGTVRHDTAGAGLDASDQDGRIAIGAWPVSGLRQADGIATWTDAAGTTWLTTANEGDPRDDNADEARVAEQRLDAAAYPDPALVAPAALGRLRVSSQDGDSDGDGDIDRLHSFGSRSFSIWSEAGWATAGAPAFDSGEALERLVAGALPAMFNVPEDGNRFDDRSDDRGPEPEQIAVARLAGRPFLFLTLERVGGIAVYEVGDPARPRFAGYINTRNFAVDPADACRRGETMNLACRQAGDLEPETLLPIAESGHSLLLIVTHKASDSLAVFRVSLAAAAGGD